MDLYRQKILDHCKNPRNTGQILHFDCRSQLDNPLCGDDIEVFLNIKNDKIKYIKFKAQGCAVAIAAMSMLSEKIKGMDIKKALSLGQREILKMLGIPLSTNRLKCGMLGLQAVKQCLHKIDAKKILSYDR